MLEGVMLDHTALFVLGPREIGTIAGHPANIQLANDNPIGGPQYRHPEKAKDVIKGMITDMHDRHIIEPSTAVWLFPIVLVTKPNGSKRMCLDFRAVNQPKNWVRNYLDDVIVWANDFTTLVDRLARVFDRFVEMGIKLNLLKCQSGQQQVRFLEHVMSERGIEPDPENVRAVSECKPKPPINVKQVC
ncbi:uncharacterized protein LOC121854006 [Homarus americanus]|uniref:uncharacterized protein LOC121854006 n=1 Tax=Homarus americanus TaxID=6706 RepID=UPI001C461340|nr:uncharacterized protein LOC121854006 [Homarus americanus]